MIRTRRGPLIHVDTCNKCPFRVLEDENKVFRCMAPTYFDGEPLLLGPLAATGDAEPPPKCELRKSQVVVLVGPYEEEASKGKGFVASKR